MDQHRTSSQSPSLDIAAIFEQLSGNDPDACRNAMEVLGSGYLNKHIAHAEILTGLIHALDAPLQEARAYAEFHLAEFGPDAAPAVPRLTALVEDDADVYGAVDALGAIGPKAQSSIPALRRAMLSQRFEIEQRERIAHAIARIGTSDILTIAAIVEVVEEYLDDWRRRFPHQSNWSLFFPWIMLVTDKYAPATHEVARSVLISFGVQAARAIMDELLPRYWRHQYLGSRILPRLGFDIVRDIGKPAMPALIAAALYGYSLHAEPWNTIIDLMRDLTRLRLRPTRRVWFLAIKKAPVDRRGLLSQPQ